MRPSASETLAWMRGHLKVLPDNGEIVWLVPPRNHMRMLGKPAGHARPTTKKKKTYWVIKMNKTALKRGRLIFLWVNGRWPTDVLDHIDGNSLNDKISNLREATITQNAWNHKGRARSLKLPMGVRKTPNGFQARIACNKKMHHLGVYQTPDEAHKVYLAKRMEMFNEFA